MPFKLSSKLTKICWIARGSIRSCSDVAIWGCRHLIFSCKPSIWPIEGKILTFIYMLLNFEIRQFVTQQLPPLTTYQRKSLRGSQPKSIILQGPNRPNNFYHSGTLCCRSLQGSIVVLRQLVMEPFLVSVISCRLSASSTSADQSWILTSPLFLGLPQQGQGLEAEVAFELELSSGVLDPEREKIDRLEVVALYHFWSIVRIELALLQAVRPKIFLWENQLCCTSVRNLN